ncbi:hypothetical protein MesoLj113c_22010 [Mesorhizobium sp. 113-3-9]|nr:hypothetical protein MesoLj113c_22010 [Mesorhizobium sp. 113-3-9]
MTLRPKSADTLAGKAFDAKRALTYAIQLKVAGQRLVTRGCVAGGLVCKSVNWSRAR